MASALCWDLLILDELLKEFFGSVNFFVVYMCRDILSTLFRGTLGRRSREADDYY
jgi:hypothetical protein